MPVRRIVPNRNDHICGRVQERQYCEFCRGKNFNEIYDDRSFEERGVYHQIHPVIVALFSEAEYYYCYYTGYKKAQIYKVYRRQRSVCSVRGMSQRAFDYLDF